MSSRVESSTVVSSSVEYLVEFKCHFSVAGAVLGEVQASLFVAGAVLGEVQVSLFVAGALLGEVQVSLFVAGAVFGEGLNVRLGAKRWYFSIENARGEVEK